MEDLSRWSKGPAAGEHVGALDGLRGAAVLAVILVHLNTYFGGAFPDGAVSATVAAIAGAGWIGVDLFFVLSGFLITGILLRTKTDPRYFRNFFVRRALRIMPLYFAFVFALWLMSATVGSFAGVAALTPEATRSLVLYYYNFHAAFTPPASGAAHHVFWSLAVEEHFYLVWPIFVLLLSPRRLALVCVAGIVASPVCRALALEAGFPVRFAYLPTPCRIDGLFWGALVAIAATRADWWATAARSSRPVGLAAAALILAMLVRQGHFSDSVAARMVGGGGPIVDSSATLVFGVTATVVAFAMLLVHVLNAPFGSPVRAALEARWLRSVGKYSYGMYVLHSLVLIVCVAAWRSLAPDAPSIPDVLAKLGLALVAVPTTYALAYGAYHGLERHCLVLKRRFAPDAGARRAAAQRKLEAAEA